MSHQFHRRQQPAQRLGLRGKAGENGLVIHRFTSLQPIRQLLEHIVEDHLTPALALAGSSELVIGFPPRIRRRADFSISQERGDDCLDCGFTNSQHGSNFCRV